MHCMNNIKLDIQIIYEFLKRNVTELKSHLKYFGSRIAGILQAFCTHTFGIVLVVILVLSRNSLSYSYEPEKKNAFLATHVK